MKIIETEKEFDSVLSANDVVFVDIYADWCGPCKMVGPVVEQIASEMTDVTFIKVNVDDLPELAERYGIMSIPNMIIFKKGEAASSIVGFQPKASIERAILSVK